jgi:hypothetical protein
MKKLEVIRNYRFDDANLVQLSRTAIAYMRRDAADFTANGTLPAQVTDFETQTETFENFVTDAEALGNQEEATLQKDQKAEVLRVAIRTIMTKAENKFGLQSARFKKYGTEALSRFDDANLIICARRVARVATADLTLLSPSPYGLTAAHIADLRNKANDFEHALINQKERIGDRDILQEDRVEMGNKLYDTLVAYCNTGKNIWETRDVAKYNDYVIYNTPTALPPTEIPTDQ